MPDGVRPVFVVGMARSGTTLVGTMIGAHPELTVAPETHFLDLCAAKQSSESFDSESEMLEAWRAYAAEDRFKVLDLDAAKIEAELTVGGVRDLAGMYRVLLNAYANYLGRNGWGDKTHIDYRFIDWLLSWYPTAHIVCVIRDPRATVASLLKAPWSSGQAFYYALQWRETMQIVARFTNHARMRIVRYEDFVAAPDESMRTLCEFLDVASPRVSGVGLSDDPAPINAETNWALTDWWRAHKQKALGPVSAESVDRWASELTPYEIVVIEHLCRQAMIDWRYTPRTTHISAPNALRLYSQRARRIARAITRPQSLREKLSNEPTISSPKI